MTAIGGEGAWAGSGVPGSVGGSATATLPVTVTGPALTIVVGGRGGTRIVPDNGVQDPERTHATGSQGGSSGPDGGRGGDSVGNRRGHPAGGGGGGGWKGGGAGAMDQWLDAGGGGGSSYTPDGTGLVTGVQANNFRNGRVMLSYVPGEGCSP